jgi:hypothetical protein
VAFNLFNNILMGMDISKYPVAPTLNEHLQLTRCPHCCIDNPNLATVLQEFSTTADDNTNQRLWRIYKCRRCGGIVTAWAWPHDKFVRQTYPEVEKVDQNLPGKIGVFLQQAMDSVAAPIGAVLLCASAVDEMLKQKNYVTGTLYQRIEAAAADHLLTKEMAEWAHQVRLDANSQRHADIASGLPTIEEARQSIEFTKVLGEFIFVLPAKVTRGLTDQGQSTPIKAGRGAK